MMNGPAGLPPLNGTPHPPQQPQVAINVGEIAPGIIRMEIRSGILVAFYDLPAPTFEAIFLRGLAEIQKSKSRILIAPPGALPNGGKA